MSDKPTIDQQFSACDEQLLADLLRDGHTTQEIEAAVALYAAIFTPLLNATEKIGGKFKVNPGKTHALFWRIGNRINREVTAIREQEEIEGAQQA